MFFNTLLNSRSFNWDKCKDLNRNKILGKSDYFLKSWGNENFEFDAESKEIYPKRILI